jgi:hypothetical protein
VIDFNILVYPNYYYRIWSDISTLPGDTIDRVAWLGRVPMPSNDSDWPVQARPHDKAWGVWRKALSDSCCKNEHRYVLAAQPGRLTHGLGAWLPDSSPRKSPRWDTFVQHSTQRIFLPNPRQSRHALAVVGRHLSVTSLEKYDPMRIRTLDIRTRPECERLMKLPERAHFLS